MRGSQHVLCSQTLALGDGGSQKFDSDVMDMFKMHECNDKVDVISKVLFL